MALATHLRKNALRMWIFGAWMKLCPRTASGPFYGAFRPKLVKRLWRLLWIRWSWWSSSRLRFNKARGQDIAPKRVLSTRVFFLGGTIFCCCKVGVIGENIENCRRTPRERIWRVSLVFGNLTDIAIAPSNMISLGRRSMLYFWGWPLFRGQNSSPFGASVAAASLDKILQVSPCGFNKASPTTRDSQGQLNQAEDWGPSFFI